QPEENNHTELLYQTRSDDAQEIMGRRLPWMVKWGILLVCLLFALLFVILSSLETKDGTIFHVLFQSGK
ncbi:MAG TPA: hypothetical protein VL093_13830, partial [Flavipsychrobacter sp.]|nr:hypothetical protein [Flavipsychrobacter sp.]